MFSGTGRRSQDWPGQAGTKDTHVNNRRCFAFLAVAAAVASALGLHSAAAQDWPTRPITMVVPFAAGSASDTMARILSARLSEVLGQQVVIENVAGSGERHGRQPHVHARLDRNPRHWPVDAQEATL